MTDYTNLSVGKMLNGGSRTIYTVPENKVIDNALITFANKGCGDITVSILRGGNTDGTLLIKPGYGYNSTYYDLDGDTLTENETISIYYNDGCEVRYTLVGVESDA